MSNIIKINHIVNNTIKNIYVFAGSIDINSESPWDLKDGTIVFSPKELDNIKEQNISVTILNGFIHSDDTISTIKTKIIKYTELRISTAELYLFGITTKKLNPSVLYNQLTQNDTLKLTKERLCHLLLNIINIKCDDTNMESICSLLDDPRDILEFEDLLSIDSINWDEEINYTTPIGQKIVKKKQYPFVANPYNCSIKDPLLTREYEQMVTTQNLNLLFESGNLCNNNIYICLAEEVLEYASTVEDTNAQYMLNIYYPVLRSKHNITTTEQLLSNKIKLYDEQQQLINDSFNAYNERVDLLYDIYYNKTEDIDYEENSPGVLKLSFIIHPTQKINMPLETLFKLVHSSETLPMVKYNPGTGQENIYRFYTNAYAKNGKKIPYMYTTNNNSSRKIIYISKRIAKKKRVAYYIEYNHEGTQYAIDCEFESNGNIIITTILNKINPIEHIETAVKNAINPPLLEQIKKYLEQSGYTYQIFDNLKQSNIEITDLTFTSVLELKKNINLDKYISCLSTIFTITNSELKGSTSELLMKYKRVSNYNELDSVETFINDLRKDGANEPTIIKKIVQNFKIDEKAATRYFAKWASQINVETDLFENKSVTIRTNTGFPVVIRQDKSNFKTVFQISSINNIDYIKPITIYFDSMIRMLSENQTTSIPNDEINKMCRGEEIKDVIVEEDIKVNKIRVPEDDEDVDAFLDIFATDKSASKQKDEETSIDMGKLGDFELGSPQGETKGEKDEFQGIEFGLLSDDDDESDDNSDTQDINMDGITFGELSQPSATVIDDTDDDEDFGDIDFDLLNKPSKTVEDASPVESKTSRDRSQRKEDQLETKRESKHDNSPPKKETSKKQDAPAVDMTGVPIKGNNNIFIARKEELEPSLFLKAPVGKYKAYSKTCPTQYSKQPVILTNSEKQYIDEKDEEFGTKSYDEHITYGTGDKKYHYICPRFWCLSDDNGNSRSISLEEINSGACGGWDALIPNSARKVPKGKRIVEFTDDRFHKMGSDTKNLLVYKPMHPGFQDKDQHPDGLCIPCCFGRPTTLGDGDWEIRKNKKGKEVYYNKKTTKEQKSFPKNQIKYKNSYKPEGKSKHGDGPEYDLDSNGNIIMESIRGELTSRDAPAEKRMKRFNECNQDANITKFSIKDKTVKVDEAPRLEAWPLNHLQIGYLSYPLQRFLGYNCREICQQSLSNNQLKLNQPCLLHKGVEPHDTQSFLACIADIYAVATDDNVDDRQITLSDDIAPTIQQLKQIILKKITIDSFVALQNGDLITLFEDLDNLEDIELDKFKGSQLYNTLTDKGEGKEDGKEEGLSQKAEKYIKRVVSAFINFCKYIEDSSSEIDYTYIWDLISLPEKNGGLFKNGLNLIIIRSPNDDITSKIQVICPTNAYNKQVYDINRKTLMIISQNGYYEPIYQYTKIDKRLYTQKKLFDFSSIKEDLPELGDILTYIWRDIQTKCTPKSSIDIQRTTEFKENIPFASIEKILKHYNIPYNLASQIVNYNSKVVGGIFNNADDPADYIYIPCLPSFIDITIPYTFINNNILLNSLRATQNKLTQIHRLTKGDIPCKPLQRIVENEIIIGIITETNQMVPVEPEPYQRPPDGVKLDDIETIEINNISEPISYPVLDQELLTDNTIDIERITKIKQIRLESHFYNVFRNLMRIVISYTKHKAVKNEIQMIIASPIELYYNKLIKIEKLLTDLLQDYVVFANYELDTINSLSQIEQCVNLEDRDCAQNSICALSDEASENSICKLILPKNSLISGRDNEREYFAKLSNELINYPQIKTFIFNPSKFLSFQNTTYDLNPDEIILLEGLLYDNYFEDIVIDNKNKNINNITTWGSARPSESIPYSQTFEISYKFKSHQISNCTVSNDSDKKLKMGALKDRGLDEYSIIEYKHNNNCSWELVADLISIYTNVTTSVNEVVDKIVSIYSIYVRDGIDKKSGVTFEDFIKTMRFEGKKTQAQAILNGTSLKDIITPTNYYITALDLCVIAEQYDIPIIVTCRTPIPYLAVTSIAFTKEDEPRNCLVVLSGSYKEVNSKKGPVLGCISKNKSQLLNVAEMGDAYGEFSTNKINSVINYLAFSKEKYKKTIIKRGKKKGIIIDEEKSSVAPPKVKKKTERIRVIQSDAP
jgi:hypothetical protein